MINSEIANIFRQLALFNEMADVPFKPQAFTKAADELEALDKDLLQIYRDGGTKALTTIPGIGESLAEKIVEYIKNKKIKEFAVWHKKFPIDVNALTRVPGIGPKTIKLLWQKLKIKNLRELEKAARADKISQIPHLGNKTQANILRGLAFLKSTGDRHLLGEVLPLAREIKTYFKKLAGVTNAVVAGSIRRRQETIGDFDLLITTTKPQLATNSFVHLPAVARILAQGTTRASVILKNGMQADLRVLAPESFGAGLQYFTGSKEHNIAVRKIAIARGYKLSEYGLFKGKKLITSRTEEAIYHALKMDCPPPEMRTASGEIAAAQKHALPKILPYGAVRGDLQVQSNWTDGVNSLEDLVRAAMALGREYIAITDHTKALAMTGGLDERALARQGQAIDKINADIAAGKYGSAHKKFRVLKSAEVNILADGSLDIADATLRQLDIVSAAVHTSMKMPRAAMTARLLRAMQNPYLNIIFHPTGRIINQRPAYDLDMEKIFVAAKKYQVALELDAFPSRLDLKDTHVRAAVAAGVKIVIDTDAHATEHFHYLELGEATARRAGITAQNVLNTLPVKKLLVYFQKKR